MGSLDIIILLVAVILIFQKLRSLLGTRPDTEITRTKISEESAAKIFDMIVKEAEKQQQTAVEKDSVPEENMSDLDKTLVKIPGFNKERFITGAKRAFEIIVTAFSKGDTETLENLVSKSLIKKFQEIIEKRRAEGISAETDLIGFDQAEITAAKISKNDIAKITVKFVSEQVNLLKNKDDESTLIPVVNVSEVPRLQRSGIISGGMIPKIDCCVEAVRRGVHRAHILDGRIPHSILIELFSDEGIGTMLY